MGRFITSAAISAKKLRFGPSLNILWGKDAEDIVLALAGIFSGEIPIPLPAEVRRCKGAAFGVYCQEGACFVDRLETAHGDLAQLAKVFPKQRFLNFGKPRHILNGAELPLGFAGASDLLLEKLHTVLAQPDAQPLFVINFLERLDESIDLHPVFEALLATGRQIFIALPPYYPIKKLEELPYETIKIPL